MVLSNGYLCEFSFSVICHGPQPEFLPRVLSYCSFLEFFSAVFPQGFSPMVLPQGYFPGFFPVFSARVLRQSFLPGFSSMVLSQGSLPKFFSRVLSARVLVMWMFVLLVYIRACLKCLAVSAPQHRCLTSQKRSEIFEMFFLPSCCSSLQTVSIHTSL